MILSLLHNLKLAATVQYGIKIMAYINYSESVNSYNAKLEGRLPKTNFKKYWNLTEKKFNELLTRGLVSLSEWHHTSKFYNKTNFYKINNLPLFMMAIGEKANAYESWKDQIKNKYVVKVVSHQSSKFSWYVIVSKKDANINTLIDLGLEFHKTKSNNYSFYLHQNKLFLNHSIVRELFSKSSKFNYIQNG